MHTYTHTSVPPPHTHTHPPSHPIHAAFLCHLGLSIKNVLSPESGPIKGRIPGRRADKAYLINKCFTITGACAPRHTLPACLWYLIIHPFHSVREGGEGQLTVSLHVNTVACSHVSGMRPAGRPRTKTGWHGANSKVQKKVAHSKTWKEEFL